jgi:Flp pilus assembly protein TadG
MAISKHSMRRQRGSQIVELAVVLPLLVFLTLVIIEGAGLLRAHQVIVNAARETARAAILKENSSDPSNMLENVGTCYLLRNQVTVPTANVPASCTQKVTSPTCTTYSITVSGQNGTPALPPVKKADGTFMSVSEVKVSCTYQFKWLSKLQGIGFSLPNTVNLGSAVDFRTFY